MDDEWETGDRGGVTTGREAATRGRGEDATAGRARGRSGARWWRGYSSAKAVDRCGEGGLSVRWTRTRGGRAGGRRRAADGWTDGGVISDGTARTRR